MEITRNEKSNVSILELDGRLDLVSGGELKEEVKSLFAKKKVSIPTSTSPPPATGLVPGGLAVRLRLTTKILKRALPTFR